MRLLIVLADELRSTAGVAKAVALREDASDVSKDATQASGSVGMRACHTNYSPVGSATTKPNLRARLPIDIAAERLARFFNASVELMTVLARAAGHRHLQDFNREDLTTFKSDMAQLTGVAYGGVNGP